MVVLRLKAHRNFFVSSRRRKGYHLQQDAGAKWHLPAVLSKWDRICKKMLCASASQIFGAKWHLPCSAWQIGSLLQEDAHVRPTRTSHCSRRRRAPSRHRSALLWNSATRATMDSGGPRSKISRGGGRKRSRSSRDVTLENMTYKWSHQLSSSNSGKRAQSTIVPVRRVKPCEAVLVKHWACVT